MWMQPYWPAVQCRLPTRPLAALQTTADDDDRRQRAKQYWPINFKWANNNFWHKYNLEIRQNRKTQKLHIFTLCYMIILLKASKTHCMCIDCISIVTFQLQHTTDVQCVLPSCEHTSTDTFSTRWQQRRQHLAADRSKRQSVAAWVRQHCGSASRTHAAA